MVVMLMRVGDSDADEGGRVGGSDADEGGW